MDDYGKKVLEHYKIQNSVLFDLMLVAQRLCPDGEWVFQMFARFVIVNEKPVKKFHAVVTNGDDNVTAISENPAAAVALLIHYLLDGSVFPLTGNGGVKFFPADQGWIRPVSEDGAQEE